MTFVAIDFETANFAADSACSVGLVKVVDGTIVDSVVHLIRPPTNEFRFTYIHGLTWKHVAGARNFGQLWPDIAAFIEGADFLAAHNASFDEGVLRACLASYGIAHRPPRFECTVKIARKVWNLRPTKLPDVCRHLDIELNHHEALSDALACAKIMIAANAAKPAKPATNPVRRATKARVALNAEPRVSSTAISEGFAAALAGDEHTAFIHIDAEGAIGSWNAGARALFGYDAHEALGRRADLIVPEEHRAGAYGAGFGRTIGSKWRGAEGWSPIEPLHKNGERIAAEVMLTPFRRPEGAVVGVLAMFRRRA